MTTAVNLYQYKMAWLRVFCLYHPDAITEKEFSKKIDDLLNNFKSRGITEETESKVSVELIDLLSDIAIDTKSIIVAGNVDASADYLAEFQDWIHDPEYFRYHPERFSLLAYAYLAGEPEWVRDVWKYQNSELETIDEALLTSIVQQYIAPLEEENANKFGKELTASCYKVRDWILGK